jgi:HAD superfamily hydrolase (TIGR01459 family)
MKIINNFTEIANNYDYFIFDIWGVVHDGSHLYPGILEILKFLRSNQKKICFLSNAPRRKIKVEEVLNRFGISRDFYDFVLTSGECSYDELKKNQENNYSHYGKNYFYIGPNKDLNLLDGLNYSKTDKIENAHFVITTGFDNDDSNIDEKLPLAFLAKKHNLTMICVNPDLIVVKQNGSEMICAGALALEYEKIGGKVDYFGKPYSKVYEMTLEKFGISKKDKILAIGDGILTDIKGANDFKIDNLLVCSGILSNEIQNAKQENIDNKINQVLNSYNIFPKYLILKLSL